MPKETFFNLPKNKQDAINEASIKEFSRVSFNEVSINQIIHNAGISRGSFYMYFEDKEDLYQHLLKTHQEKLNELFESIIEQNNGDLIKTYLSLFNCIMDHIDKHKEEPFFQNMILNVGQKSESLFCKQNPNIRIWEDHIASINFNLLKFNDRENIYDIIDILNAMLIHSLILTLKGKNDRDFSYQKLERQLFILRNGLYKQEEENR